MTTANPYGRQMQRTLRRYGGRVAVEGRGDARTYEQLLDNGARLANALAARGVHPGAHVAALLEDRAVSLEVYVACALGGYTLVHVNDRLAAGEIAHVLADSHSEVLVHTDGRSGLVDDLDRSGLRATITIGDERPSATLGYDELLAAASARVESVARDAEDIAIIGYTSGTTGFPKGAMVSQRALLSCIQLIAHSYRLPLYGRCAFTGTLSFISGMWGVILPHLWLGATLDFLAGTPPDELVDVMITRRSTFTYAPSPLVPALVAATRERPEVLTTLMSVLHSASALPPAHMQLLIETFGDRVVEVWGMTESAGNITATTRLDYAGECAADDLYATVGRPVNAASVRVVDSQTGSDLGPGRTGELVVEADTMFSGYYGQPEQTAEVFDGVWYRTGDIGHVDAAGYVYVTDRAKDMIVSGGMNVYPAEVEAALVQMDAIAEVGVFGVPDDRWGEAVAAAVVLRPGTSADADGVIAFVRDRLASYKKPQHVYFVEELPRNVSLKVQRHVLRTRFSTGEEDRDG